MSETHREIQRLFDRGATAARTDAQLLDRYANDRDGEAFAALVRRHGPMVMAVCRGSLRNAEDAADAFQATFLVLSRRAGSFPVGDSLGGWLRRVARRVARQARLEASRRRARERSAVVPSGTAVETELERQELAQVLREEVDRLPDRYRIPIQLCDLQGLTRDEAAGLLGWPAGTIGGRLARGRNQLRRRLHRRGVTAAGLSLAGFAEPPETWRRAIEEATRAAGAPGGSASAVRLASRAARGLSAVRLAACLAFWLATGAAVWAAALLRAADPRTPASPRRLESTANAQVTPPPPDPDDPTQAEWFSGRVNRPDGRPLAGARLYLVPSDPLPLNAGPIRARSGPDGRFRFAAPDLTFSALDGLPSRRQGLLIAAADGYAPDWVVTYGQTGSTFVSHLDPRRTADWTLTLAVDDVPLKGRLLGPDARPLVGATVRLTGLKVPRNRDLDAHLEHVAPKSALFYTVDYERSLHRPSILPGMNAVMVTDAEGRFQFQGLGRDRLVDLEVVEPGIETTTIHAMTRVGPDAPTAGGRLAPTVGSGSTVTLKPGKTITGVVRDAATGAPLPGVWVGSFAEPIRAFTEGSYPRVTDPDGRFSIVGIGRSMRGLKVMAVPKPGQPYFLATATVDENGEAVVSCPRGIPFRLTLRDEEGRPVEADVEYSSVSPNPRFGRLLPRDTVQAGAPLSVAQRQADGSYRGVALVGPGVVTAQARSRTLYRPAHVDMKKFFEPGRTNWTAQERITAYGTDDTIAVETFYGGAWLDQHAYAAIVPVNPSEGSAPLELSATVVKDRPRRLTILDPDGRPVLGVETSGLTAHPWDWEPRLRASTIPLTGLHPERTRSILMKRTDRKLVGRLLARGDGDSPYIVRLQPWASLSGRIVDPDGKPLGAAGPPGKIEPPSRATLSMDSEREFAVRDDPTFGRFPPTQTAPDGRFRVEGLVPGLRYAAEVYVDYQNRATAFDGLTLAPGEDRELGDIRLEPRPR